MTNNPAGLLVVVGFVVAAVGSAPLSVLTFLLARRVQPFSRALRYAGGGVAVAMVTLSVAVAIITPEAGVLVAGVAAALAVVLWVGPLAIARWVLVRRGVDPERALRDATVGLPMALLVSLLVVFGWGRRGGRYNITFLTGVEAAVAWTTLALVVLVGPAVVALVVERARHRPD